MFCSFYIYSTIQVIKQYNTGDNSEIQVKTIKTHNTAWDKKGNRILICQNRSSNHYNHKTIKQNRKTTQNRTTCSQTHFWEHIRLVPGNQDPPGRDQSGQQSQARVLVYLFICVCFLLFFFLVLVFPCSVSCVCQLASCLTTVYMILPPLPASLAQHHVAACSKSGGKTRCQLGGSINHLCSLFVLLFPWNIYSSHGMNYYWSDWFKGIILGMKIRYRWQNESKSSEFVSDWSWLMWHHSSTCIKAVTMRRCDTRCKTGAHSPKINNRTFSVAVA